jgi:hypothetical protein
MPEAFEHVILNTKPHQSAEIVAALRARIPAERLFGLFVPQIGLSVNRIVVLTEGPAGPLDDIDATIERREFWEPAPRPAPGERLTDAQGYYSHRWFECRDADWPRFQELSVTAWDNFEDSHPTRVVGFWRAVTPPAPGVTRVWLMAWYRDLAAWEGSRWYQASPDPKARASYERFRLRRELTLDSAVSVLRLMG